MSFRKAASGILCAGFLTQAGAALADADPPLPVPRPAAAANQAQNEAQPKALPNKLDQALTPQALNPVDPAARKTYQALIKREAEKNGLPTDIADAVAAIESGYDPGAIGSVRRNWTDASPARNSGDAGLQRRSYGTCKAGREYSLRRDLP